MKRIILMFLAVGFISVQSIAQTTTRGIEKTQKLQQEKIKEGIKNGELTRHETRSLEKQQAHIQHDKKIAKKDGMVTKSERKHLKSEQARAGKNIFRKKHNDRTKM